MYKVVITDASYPDLERERAAATRHGAQFVAAHCLSTEDVIHAVADADVVLVQYSSITDEVLSHMKPNSLVIRYGMGLDNIDVQAASRRGIRVAYIPDYATGEVADHTAALILCTVRLIIQLDLSVRNGNWDVAAARLPLPGLSQLCVGFIGFGRIGRQVYSRLRPFGIAALISDPFVQAAEVEALGARTVELETLFAEADVITLHAPLTTQTRHLVNAERLASMKRTAYIVNTSRGGLIDSVALSEALAREQIAGAALDVFEQEPLPMDSRLRVLPNVILTPHAAWYSTQSIDRIQTLAADEVERALSGRPARCPVLA